MSLEVLFPAVGATADSLKSLVSEKTPSELDDINRKKLATMGVQNTVIHVFMGNVSYDPWKKTLLIGALEGAAGKELWVTGMVDQTARKAPEKRGLKVEDNIQERLLKNAGQ